MKSKVTLVLSILFFITSIASLMAQSESIVERSKRAVDARKKAIHLLNTNSGQAAVSTGIPSKIYKKGVKKSISNVLTVSGKKFFGYNAFSNSSIIPQGPVSFHSQTPSVITSIVDQSSEQFVQGSTWANGQWYGTVYGTNDLVTIDTSTGQRTILGNLGIEITGLAYDWTTSTMFAMGVENSDYGLYTLNMSDYSLEYIGYTGNSVYTGLGCDLNGDLFTVDLSNDQVVLIDNNSGEPEIKGSLGFNANWAQELEFDNSSNTLYFSAFNADIFSGELYTVNTTDGNLTLVGTYDGGLEVTGLCIPNNFYNHDVSVYIISPVSGSGLTSNEVITIGLVNSGTSDESDIPVFYRVNGGPVISEIATGNLNSLNTDFYVFNTVADLSIPDINYTIEVWHEMSGDEDHSNDTAVIVLFNGLFYCQASTMYCYDYIAQVQLGSINNTSECTINGYQDYTQLSTVLDYGQTGYLTVLNGMPGSFGMCGIWIDWNRNGDFYDDEQVLVFTDGDSFHAAITVPNNALSGPTRMRIMISSSDFPTPCANAYNGEIEDYNIVVTGQQILNDLGVSQVLSPLVISAQPYIYYPEVEITNYGNATQSDFQVNYAVDNGPVITEIYPGNINSGNTGNYTFSQPVTFLNCGNHSVKYFTSLVGDQVLSNDSLLSSITASVYLTINQASNVQQVVSSILPGNGISISNIIFTGDSNAIGSFNASCSTLGLDSGLVLASGYVTTAIGPNNSSSAGSDLQLDGDTTLTMLAGSPTFDAAILEFDMIPQYDTILFRYVFGSEEYPEYVDQFNDVFAFFITGPKPGGGNYVASNIALVPGVDNIPVSINTINNGQSNSGPCMNCGYYITNYGNELQLDAYTSVLTASFIAIPGATYHLRIAIADALDHVYDSDVFLEKGSFSSPSGNVSLSGQVEYKNTAETKLGNVVVKLKQNGVQVAQTLTNAYGNYEFANLSPGIYQVEAESNAPWGGGNSVDGLGILKHFVGMESLHGLFKDAAHLNGDGSINSTDAMLDVRRFVGLITSFPIGSDWVFEQNEVTITGTAPVILDIEGLCRGDVNGSFIP